MSNNPPDDWLREILGDEDWKYTDKPARILAHTATMQAEWYKSLRSNKLLCETCWVRRGGSWGGSAMTSWNCARCNGHQLSGSTAHESICLGCAIGSGKCQWCNHNNHMLAPQ